MKRSKKAKDVKASEETAEDAALLDGDIRTYAELLGPRARDDSDDDDDDDEDGGHPLVVDAPAAQESGSARAQRWFSNPLFDGMAAEEALAHGADATDTAARVAAAMPLTDKQLRKEKRKRDAERRERKMARRRVDADDKLDVAEPPRERSTRSARAERRAPAAAAGGAKLDQKRADQGGCRKKASPAASDAAAGFEVAPREPDPNRPGADSRAVDSEHEDYDSDDRATSMAIASMMLRRSKAKELVDASYNRCVCEGSFRGSVGVARRNPRSRTRRYAWNDSKDLPEWFVDDEAKHYRPQVPISKELQEQMREKFKSLASKPIAKVAEARARKRQRAASKLKAAKKKAELIADNPEMSERQKLKAITGAMNGSRQAEKPNKVYVVARNSRGLKSAPTKGKGAVAVVDPRLKADKRGLRAAKKRAKAGMKKRHKRR